MPDPNYQDIPWAERPDVEVLVDGVWCPGEIRARRRLDGDIWQAYVHYSVDRDGYRHTLVAWLPYDEQLRLADSSPPRT